MIKMELDEDEKLKKYNTKKINSVSNTKNKMVEYNYKITYDDFNDDDY